MKCALVRLLVMVAVVVGPRMLLAADDEAEPARAPGLVATYSLAASGKTVLTRYDALPAFRLAAGETPDPRLPAQGWRADWTGVIEVLKPGKYQFSTSSSGAVEIQIGGQTVLSAKGAASDRAMPESGAPVELKFGLHPLAIHYVPGADGARLKLYWEGDAVPREPLPGFAVGHLSTDRPVSDNFPQGWLAVEEHSCVACHQASNAAPIAAQLARRPGPRLTQAGARLKPGWIYRWLADPSAVRPEAVMPRLFASDRQGDVERYCVAMFLASLEKPAAAPEEPAENERQKLAHDGEGLFLRVGCAVCHDPQGKTPARATLAAQSAKMPHSALTAYLLDPLAVDPAGRMPGFKLSRGEAQQLAAYIATRQPPKAGEFDLPEAPAFDEIREAYLGRDPSAQEVLDFSALEGDAQLAALGQRIFAQRNCAACHELKIDGKLIAPLKVKSDFVAICKSKADGCLAPLLAAAAEKPVSPTSKDSPAGAAAIPRFGRSLDRELARAFLHTALAAPGTPAPAELARITLQRFNCMGCHQRNGDGGLSTELLTKLVANQTEQNAESVSPPPLTAVTEKLSETAIRGVLEGDLRARPWMSLQMPHFGKDNVHALPAGLASLDGEALAPKNVELVRDLEAAAAGRTLVGSKGFGCTKCHDMLGKPTSGTRGPDLANVTDRIQYGWYHRWMTDPQRIQPGTRMPTVFLNGQSPYKDVLGGDPDRQKQAIWQYLAASREMPPPEGMEAPKAEIVASTERPALLRTFLPEVTPRSIAIRFPSGINMAYDAQACRLAYAWTGEFLDMSPVWTGRGGNRATLKGPVFWRAPAGFPWAVTPSAEPLPDFRGRGADPTWGADMPQDGKLHPSKLHFRGYQTAGAAPVFRYDLELEGGVKAAFTETIAPLSTEFAQGTLRQTKATVPGGSFAWLNVALCDAPPQFITTDSPFGALAASGPSSPGNSLVRVVDAGKPLVVHLRSSSQGAEWLAQQQDGKWVLMARLPVAAGTKQAEATLAVWRPVDDQQATIDKTLATEREQSEKTGTGK